MPHTREEILAIGKKFADKIFHRKHNEEESESLTWQDIRNLHIIFQELDVEIEMGKSDIQPETVGYYEEDLRRFKK